MGPFENLVEVVNYCRLPSSPPTPPNLTLQICACDFTHVHACVPLHGPEDHRPP